MPRAVVALIELDNGEIGTLCCSQIDFVGLTSILKEKGTLHKIELEGWHTNTLPNKLKEGNLDGLTKEITEIIKCPPYSNEYQLHVYSSTNYDEVYLKISTELSKN